MTARLAFQVQPRSACCTAYATTRCASTNAPQLIRVHDLYEPHPTFADNWASKALRRRTQGTGRMRYLKSIPRKFKNGFRENSQARPKGATA